MANIIQAKYTSFAYDDQDYPSLRGLVDKSAMPHPRQTKASTNSRSGKPGNQTSAGGKTTGKPESHFIMKKFQNIPGKLNLPNTKKPVVEEAN
jgi:hypothetical protein